MDILKLASLVHLRTFIVNAKEQPSVVSRGDYRDVTKKLAELDKFIVKSFCELDIEKAMEDEFLLSEEVPFMNINAGIPVPSYSNPPPVAPVEPKAKKAKVKADTKAEEDMSDEELIKAAIARNKAAMKK